MKRELHFNPLQYGEVFGQWDNPVFEREPAEKEARAARDRIAAQLRENGKEVECFEKVELHGRTCGSENATFEVTVYGMRYTTD